MPVGALALAIVITGSSLTFAQTKPQSEVAPAASADQSHDLSGVWMRNAPPATGLEYWVYEFSKEDPPMTPWGEAQFKAARSSFGDHPYPLNEVNDPLYHNCAPPGVPRIYLHPTPVQIVAAPGELIMLFEYDFIRRQIFIDGRPHDKTFGPMWMGDSIGHWEGDTLVVDTVNFNTKTWLDRMGHPHSDALHVIERFRRPDHEHLALDITIDDPKAYSKPWTTHLDFLLKPWTLEEHLCVDYDTFQNVEKGETMPAK
jgi:hypothetical protein